jgi:type IV secretory pathway TraG/TraD family ATPase VirD4
MNPADGCAYDHFANKNITTQKDMIIQLRDWSEDHFKGIASAHAQTVFKAMAYAGVQPDLHTFSQSLSVKAMLGLAQRGAGRKGTYDNIKAEIVARRATEKNAIESIASEVSSLTESSFGEMFDTHSARRLGRQILRLEEARERAAVVYCGLPALTFPDAASSFASLLTADLKASLPASRKQWLIVFDEFSVFANPTTVLNLVNMGRGFGASLVLATQTCADLVASGSEPFLRQVFGSVNTFVVHEVTDPVDAELIAGLFSTTTSVEYTAQIVDHQRTGSASSRTVHEFNIHPEWIKRLGLGEVYVLNKDDPDHIPHTKILRAQI